jgi:hypothetical protein
MIISRNEVNYELNEVNHLDSFLEEVNTEVFLEEVSPK